MGRHSKNATDRHHFTYQEKRKLDGVYGTASTRVGSDSQLQFGHCCCCLTVAKEPLASPSGHIYCKECIYSYMLTKMEELKEQKVAYEAQLMAQAEEELAHERKTQTTKVGSFVNTQLVVAKTQSEESKNSSALVDSGDEEEGAAEAVGQRWGLAKKKTEHDIAVEKLKKPVDTSTVEQKRKALSKTSFWLPEFQPAGVEKQIPKPDKRPKSPMSGQPLRTKDLTAVTFTYDEVEGEEGGRKRSIICPVTRREIVTQEAVVIKKSGHVMLKDAAKQFAFPTMTCPVSGVAFKKKDVLELKKCGSSFAASGKVTSEKYQPAGQF